MLINKLIISVFGIYIGRWYILSGVVVWKEILGDLWCVGKSCKSWYIMMDVSMLILFEVIVYWWLFSVDNLKDCFFYLVE